jgi:hypothetical protein
MTMQLGRLNWSWRLEEGVVRMSKDFEESDITLQLDAINDWIYLLEELREKKLEEWTAYGAMLRAIADENRTGLSAVGSVPEPSQGQALGDASRIQDPVPGKLRLVGQAPDPGVAGS